jgi:hypothetical protein
MKQKKISTTQARQHISKIIDEVEAGKAIYSITRNNQVVAKLVNPELVDEMHIDPNFANELKQVFEDFGPALKEISKR